MKKFLCGKIPRSNHEEGEERFNECHAGARIVVSDGTCAYGGGISNAHGSWLTGEYQSSHSAAVLALVIAYNWDSLHLVPSSECQPPEQVAEWCLGCRLFVAASAFGKAFDGRAPSTPFSCDGPKERNAVWR